MMRINSSLQPITKFYVLCDWVFQQVYKTKHIDIMDSYELSYSAKEYDTGKTML